MYILLADDTEDGFHTDSDWNPLLHEYQQVALNTKKKTMMGIIIINIDGGPSKYYLVNICTGLCKYFYSPS